MTGRHASRSSSSPRGPLRPIAAAALACALLLALARALALPGAAAPAGGTAWQALAPDATLAGHDAVVTAAGRMLLHAGESGFAEPPAAMRQLDLAAGLNAEAAAWSSFPASGAAPQARLDHRGLPGSRAALDPGENLLLAVCDCQGGSGYLLDLASGAWTRAPGDRDLPLWYPVLVYDAPRDRALLYGGQAYGLGDQVSRAGWAYDLSPARAGWSPLADMPAVRVHQAAALDAASGHLLSFGGQDESGEPQTTLWRLDTARAEEAGAWEDITALAGPGPSARLGATLSFDPRGPRALLYGGYTFDGDLADAWILDYADPARPSWTLLAEGSPEAGPGARSGHSAVWDPAGQRVVVYGGTRSSGDVAFLGDTWAIDPAPAAPTPGPVFLPALYNNGEARAP